MEDGPLQSPYRWRLQNTYRSSGPKLGYWRAYKKRRKNRQLCVVELNKNIEKNIFVFLHKSMSVRLDIYIHYELHCRMQKELDMFWGDTRSYWWWADDYRMFCAIQRDNVQEKSAWEANCVQRISAKWITYVQQTNNACVHISDDLYLHHNHESEGIIWQI